VANLNVRLNSARNLFLLAGLVVLPSAYASTLWTDALPSNGNTGFDAAPVYGTICDTNVSACPGGTNKAYILGDQFTLSAATNTITSVTVYEVGNAVTTEFGNPGDPPNTEYNGLDLFISPDNAATGMGAPVDILTGANLTAAATRVCYGGPCGGGGMNFESVDNSSNYFGIYAVTFTLNVTLGPGLYDFAVGANPKPNTGNVFALLTSDPNHSGTSEEDSASLCGTTGCGFLYYLPDGAANSPLATYQYQTGLGLINNYNNGADVNVVINGTAVPEPSSFGFLGLGLAGIVAGVRRARHNRV
jgi:hypothetical protein